MSDVDRSGLTNLAAPPSPTRLLLKVLHDVAQPLTILAALLDDAAAAAEPVLAGDSLAMAHGECCRAVAALRSLEELSLENHAQPEREGPL